jgi:hypothetical protein
MARGRIGLSYHCSPADRGNLIRVQLKPIAGEAASQWKPSPAPFSGWLLDANDYGVGIKAPQDDGSQLFSYPQCCCRLGTSDAAELLEFTGSLQFARPMPDYMYYLSFSFRFENGTERFLCLEKLLHIIDYSTQALPDTR